MMLGPTITRFLWPRWSGDFGPKTLGNIGVVLLRPIPSGVIETWDPL